MKLGVNLLCRETDRSFEQERYLRGMLASVCRVQPEIEVVLFGDRSAGLWPDNWRTVAVAGMPQIERAAKLERVDVLLSPWTAAFTKCAMPQVLLTFDMTRLDAAVAERGWRGAAHMKELRRICTSAAALIAPSQFVQRKCLDLLDIALDKVVVAPPGVDAVFGEPQPPFAEGDYVIADTGTEAFKNVANVRKALGVLKDEIPPALIVVGPADPNEESAWGEDVLRIYNCPQAQLAALLQHAALFVSVPFRDWAGQAVLEALRAGAPVAASRVGAIPEVGGDAPMYVNPDSPNAIASGIRRLLGEAPEAREHRQRFGKQMAARYTWENCAWKAVAAFRHACR